MIKKIVFIFCMCFLWHNAAQAKGFFIVNTGDEVFNVAPFPQEITSEIEELKNFQVGYKCNHFGILWADFRIWNCILVGVNPTETDTYYELPQEITDHLKSKPEYQEDKMQRNFWNHYGMYILIIVIIGFLIIRLKKPSSKS